MASLQFMSTIAYVISTHRYSVISLISCRRSGTMSCSLFSESSMWAINMQLFNHKYTAFQLLPCVTLENYLTSMQFRYFTEKY